MQFGATKRLAKLTMTVSASAAVLLIMPLSGCDDPHQADRRVRDAVTQARIERAKGTADGTAAAQKKLEDAAKEANAAPVTQAHSKSVLAQAQYDAAVDDISNPTSGVEATNRDIIRLIHEINQLGQQINASNSLVRVYQQMEPKEARSAVQQRILEATGDPSKPAWIGQGDAAVPTLTAVQQQVEQQQAAVDKQQELIKSLQAKQDQTAAQAAQAASQAEAAQGRAGFDLFKQGVGLRKQAADLANQVDVEQSKLAQLAHNLKLAQARQQAVTTAIQQFQELGKNIESGWKGVEAQAGQQKKLSAAILQGAIADKTKALDERISANKAKYDSAEANLTASIENYQAAASAAKTLKNDLSARSGPLPSGNQMKVAMDTLGNVFNPSTFDLGQATSQLALGNLQVSRAQTLNERAHLTDALNKTLTDAGLAPPGTLRPDAKLGEEIKKTTEEANKNYTAAMELFNNVSSTGGSGAGADALKKGAQAGQIYALYGQALLARATGADAKQQIAAAISARDTVLADSPGALAALPAELVPPPSTQPAAPAHATTAPAGATTEGAAPATTPAEGTPATTPAEGATQPAEGATQPAEGAAPAAPATPAP